MHTSTMSWLYPVPRRMKIWPPHVVMVVTLWTKRSPPNTTAHTHTHAFPQMFVFAGQYWYVSLIASVSNSDISLQVSKSSATLWKKIPRSKGHPGHCAPGRLLELPRGISMCLDITVPLSERNRAKLGVLQSKVDFMADEIWSGWWNAGFSTCEPIMPWWLISMNCDISRPCDTGSSATMAIYRDGFYQRQPKTRARWPGGYASQITLRSIGHGRWENDYVPIRPVDGPGQVLCRRLQAGNRIWFSHVFLENKKGKYTYLDAGASQRWTLVVISRILAVGLKATLHVAP